MRNTQAWVQLSTSHVATSCKGWSSVFSGVFKNLCSLFGDTVCWSDWTFSLEEARAQSVVSTGRSRVHLEWPKEEVLMFVCFFCIPLPCPWTKWYSCIHQLVIVTTVLKEKSRRNIQILQNRGYSFWVKDVSNATYCLLKTDRRSKNPTKLQVFISVFSQYCITLRRQVACFKQV